MKVGLVGAQGTGKSTLAPLLASHDILVLDESALPGALGQLRHCDAVLVMGLDLPGESPQGVAARADADARLRGLLQSAGFPYRVVYGHGPERLAAALHALGLAPPRAETPRGGRAWSCEACSDPECEHRLFTGLMATGRRS
jgi:hypothetical protein